MNKPISEVEKFYRQEASKTGWTLKKSEPRIFRFVKRGKDAIVSLTRSGDATSIKLAIRDVTLANSEGLLPDAGKGRLVFANAHSSPVVFTIGETDHKLKVGQGANSTKTALNKSVAPGSYKVIVKIPGQPSQTELLEIGKDETWGIIHG